MTDRIRTNRAGTSRRTGELRGLRRSLAAVVVLALMTTVVWACPGVGRSDRQVVKEGRESDEVLDCSRATIATAGPGLSIGRTAGDVCVKWIEDGFVYNPRTPKDGMKVTDEREVVRHRTTYKCEDNQYLFGLLGSIDCVPQNTQEVEAQLHVLAEERCRAVAQAGTPGIVPAIEGAESP